jgi:hypothetical protein
MGPVSTTYTVHPDTITALRSHTGKSVKLSMFTSDKLMKSEIMSAVARLPSFGCAS